MISPVYTGLAEAHSSTATFLKVDVDELGDVAAAANVTAMPTFQFVKNGNLVDQLRGADPQKLEALGADVIQTEGKVSLHPSKGGYQGLIEKAAPTLAAAHALSRAVSIPVMAASGLSDVTAPLAKAAGARGVGVGSAVNKLDSEVAMLAVVRSISQALLATSAPASASKTVPATSAASSVSK